MKKASILILIAGLFLISVWSVKAQAVPTGYFQYGDFYCSSDPNFEKPASILGQKFCQPQITGCQTTGGKFCTAGARNACCPGASACGRGTVFGFEVAICVPPTVSVCGPKSPGYAGLTKDGQSVCCRVGQESGPAGRGKNTPYCQPRSASVCAPGERFVQGFGNYKSEKRCCTANTNPSHHPNGLPFCANLPFKVVAPNGGEQISKSDPPYPVKWTATNIPPTQQIKLRLINSQTRITYQNNFLNTGSASLYFSSPSFPPGQYKIELSAIVNGVTIIDQSDSFFTLIDNNPPAPPAPAPASPTLSPPANNNDTIPPDLYLTAPNLGQTVPNKETRIQIEAADITSGVRSTSIGVKAPGAISPLLKICNHSIFNPPFAGCALTVPANRWVVGTLIAITAMDNSPNRNAAFLAYKISLSQQLQTQDLSGSKIIISTSIPWCHTFNTNLSIGMNGNEVTALQTALAKAGFSLNNTGSYDENTAAAVSNFQLKYRSELLTPNGLNYPTGYFGPSTRQKINQLYGCG